MRTALFPGSFDPFTLGHMDILRSALKMFDKVIVAVGYNSAKSGFFSPDLRVRIIEDAVAGLGNVEVCSYRGLTVDFCKEKGVNCIIRGLRTTTDFEMESVIAQANRKMAPDIQSIFIPSGHEHNLRVLIVYLFFLPVMLPSVLPKLGTDSAVRRFPGVWKLLSF